jgi:hypothetical protein
VRRRDLKNKRVIQAAVRQVADEYLSDPNINSVGIGYRVRAGERTNELVLQFTVGKKVKLEALESVASRIGRPRLLPARVSEPHGPESTMVRSVTNESQPRCPIPNAPWAP